MANRDSIRVEAATADDIDVVTDLWVSLARGQREHGASIRAERNRRAVRESIARRVVTGELLVARDDDATVGFVTFSLEHGGYERDHARGTIGNLFVTPDRRGRGIGAELLISAERSLREAGAEVIGLEAMAKNDRARTFYRDHGYEPHRIELTKSMDDEE